MDSQPSDLFDTASQPDTAVDAYTFLEFNSQGDSEFDFPEFRSPNAWPTPSDSISVVEPSDRGGGGVPAADHHSEASSPSSLSAKAGRGGSSSQADALAAGIGNLNFEETGDDDGFDYGKNDFTEHACKYCGISNPACVVRCNVASCRKWFCNSRGNTSGSHIVNHLVSIIISESVVLSCLVVIIIHVWLFLPLKISKWIAFWLLILRFEPNTRRFVSIETVRWVKQFSNATTVGVGMSFFSVSSQQLQTVLSSFSVEILV